MSSDTRRDLEELPGLPPQRAFWEALATVGIPSLVISSLLLYWVGFRTEEWLIYAIVFFIPVVLLLPIVFIRYLNGVEPRKLTRQQHILRGVLMAGLAIADLMLAPWRPRSGWDLAVNLAHSLALFVCAVDHIWRAIKAENSSAAAIQ